MLGWILLLLPFGVLGSFDHSKAQSFFNRESYRNRHFFKRDLIHNDVYRRMRMPTNFPAEVFDCSGSFSGTHVIDERKVVPDSFIPGLCADAAVCSLRFLDCQDLAKLSLTSSLTKRAVNFELDRRTRPFMDAKLSTIQTHILTNFFEPIIKRFKLPRCSNPNDLCGILLVGLIRYSQFAESGFKGLHQIGPVMKVLVEFASKLPIGKIVLETSESAVIKSLLAAAYQFNLVHTYELFVQLNSFKWSLTNLNLSLCCRSKVILAMLMNRVVPAEEHIFQLLDDEKKSAPNLTVGFGSKCLVRYASLLMFAVRHRQLALLELVLEKYNVFDDFVIEDALNHALFQNSHEILWTLLKKESIFETALRVNLDLSDLIIFGKSFAFQILSELDFFSRLSAELRNHLIYFSFLFNRREIFKEMLKHIEYPNEARTLFLGMVGLLAMQDKREFWLALMANQRFLEAVREFDCRPLWKRILFTGNGQFIYDLWAFLPEYVDHSSFALHLVHDNYINIKWRSFILQRMDLSKVKDHAGNEIAFVVVQQMCDAEITASVLGNPTTNHRLLVKRILGNKISYISLIDYAKAINNIVAVEVLSKIKNN